MIRYRLICCPKTRTILGILVNWREFASGCTERFIFSHAKDDWIAEFANNPHRRTFRDLQRQFAEAQFERTVWPPPKLSQPVGRSHRTVFQSQFETTLEGHPLGDEVAAVEVV